MRLDKMLAHLGLGSRKEVAALVRQGRVASAEGAVLRDAAAQVDAEVPLFIDGVPHVLHARHDLMLHKPAGVLTATMDKRQQTVLDLLPRRYAASGVNPVGRLDKDVTGLLILTDDGQLAHRLLSPKTGVGKVYEARVEGMLRSEMIDAFAAGLALDDGAALPAKLEILAADAARVTVFEGRFHQVKRMFAAVGCPVLALKRLAMGGVWLDEALAPGQFRPLAPGELAQLERASREGWGQEK